MTNADTRFDLLTLVNALETDWKTDETFLNIVSRHKDEINNAMNEEYTMFRDVLEIYPPQHLILNAFNHLNVSDLKVVILSQDPYHRENEAMGLCFSVPEGVKCPPSLRNIFKELQNEYGGIVRKSTDLTDWAKQGVLLLNTSLTVRQGSPLSHSQKHVWNEFTKDIMKYIGNNLNNVVFMLWGNVAQEIASLIDIENNKNLVLMHSHPSPLSRKSFIGHDHFKKCNAYLQKHGKVPIVWL